MKDPLPTLAGKFLDVIRIYLQRETGSPVGVLNLIVVAIVAVTAILLLAPKQMVSIVGHLLGRPTPDWGPLVLLGALAIVASVAIVCIFMIPKEPPA